MKPASRQIERTNTEQLSWFDSFWSKASDAVLVLGRKPPPKKQNSETARRTNQVHAQLFSLLPSVSERNELIKEEIEQFNGNYRIEIATHTIKRGKHSGHSVLCKTTFVMGRDIVNLMKARDALTSAHARRAEVIQNIPSRLNKSDAKFYLDQIQELTVPVDNGYDQFRRLLDEKQTVSQAKNNPMHA